MSEIEVPIEKIQEDIHHLAEHAGHKPFVNMAALLSAFLAAFAAVSALFAGHFANDAMLEQIKASDRWAYYQAKGVKLAITEFRNQTATTPELVAKIEGYKRDQESIKEEAEHIEVESRAHLARHEKLAASVTFFQIAITLTAIAVLTRKRRFLMVSGGLGAVGLAWMIFAFVST